MGAISDQISDCLEALSIEARELYLAPKITELLNPPTPIVFLRDYVSKNLPLVIRGGCADWPACKKWNHKYLREKLGKTLVTVAVTPNGYADAVFGDKFTLPEERIMKFREFLDILEEHDDDGGGGGDDDDGDHHRGKPAREKPKKNRKEGVYYVQKQNSSLTTEFEVLRGDVGDTILWAEEAFGCQPDAINFWMGEKNAVTSMHKDHYENIYCVLEGCKTFILLPPSDQSFIHYEIYPVFRFKLKDDNDDDDNGGDDKDGDDDGGDDKDDDGGGGYEDGCGSGGGYFELVDEKSEVRWTPIDPVYPDLDLYPNYGKCRPLEVKVRKGDVLYLPSLWFHHVAQTHGCIAVNYWYDMSYDLKYNYFKCVESIVDVINKRKQSS